MSSNRMHTFALRAVIRHVRDTGEWVVVVAKGADDDAVLPSRDDCARELLRVLAAHGAPGSEMAGRTLIFPEGGRVTVARGSHPVAGTGYRVMFLGFEGHLDPSEEIALHTWRQGAEGTIGLGERPGDLRIS
jgi:hypothetical protein